jgi:hypothetical protein
MELAVCPECGLVAEIEWRDQVPAGWADDGLVKLRCIDRHWFLMPSGRVVMLGDRVQRPQHTG